MRDTAVIARNDNGSRGPLPDRGSRAEGDEKFALTPVRKLSIGRQTVSSDAGSLMSPTGGDVRRPLGRDRRALEALKVIRDLDPIASDAVFVLLRMLNPGHNLKAYQFQADGSEIDSSGDDAPPLVKSAQLAYDGLARRVGAEYGGGLDQLVNVLGLQVLTHGAVALEVAPMPDLRDVEDWYPVDPLSLHFKRVALTDAQGNDIKNEMTGVTQTRLALGQRYASGKFIEVNTEQVFYMPLDPDTDDFYGRPPLLAAVSSAMFLAQMLHDLRQVAHNQGYPRIDVKVMWDVIKDAAPPHLMQKGSEAEFAEWAQTRLDEVVDAYTGLEIDDTFVHFDWVEIANSGGISGGGATFDFKAFESVLVRQLSAALKTLPILLGINESTSETHGSVQWQIQVAGVDALRKIVKRIVEKAANVSAQLLGIPAHGKMEYTEIRTVDRLFEANAEFIETKTLVEQVKQGWRDNDEASEIATGHAAKGEPGEFGGALAELEMAAIEAGIAATASNESQQPSETEKQQTASNAIPPLVLQLLDSALDPPRRQRRTFELDGDVLDRLADAYGDRGVAIFSQLVETLLAGLAGEGLYFRSADSDVVDGAFGIGYRREMKALLRQSIEQGMQLSGPITDATAPRRIVRSIWQENEPFIERIRRDLSQKVSEWRQRASGSSPATLAEVQQWFQDNAYRQEMMGRFLGKQGLASGYVHQRTLSQPDTAFAWHTSSGKPCRSCQSRGGNTYSGTELAGIGFPGSIQLDCAANCKCSLSDVSCSGTSTAGRAAGASGLKAAACAMASQDAITLDNSDVVAWQRSVKDVEAFRASAAAGTAKGARMERAVAGAPPAPELYRGMGLNKGVDPKTLFGPVGKVIDLPLSSFADQKYMAGQFLPEQGSNVMITLSKGSRSVDLRGNVRDTTSVIDGEFVSAGKFEVKALKISGDPGEWDVKVTLRQVSPP